MSARGPASADELLLRASRAGLAALQQAQAKKRGQRGQATAVVRAVLDVLGPAASLVFYERAKQLADGYDAEHDDRHSGQELAWVGAMFMAPDTVLAWAPANSPTRTLVPPLREPQPPHWGPIERLKRPVNPNDLLGDHDELPEDADFSFTLGNGHPKTEVRHARIAELTKGAALAIAEIERIQRCEAP